MSPFTTENHSQRSLVIRTASERNQNPTTDAHSSAPDLSTPSTTHNSAGFSSHHSSEPQPQYLPLQSHNSSNAIEALEPPAHVNHRVIQTLHESFLSAPKRTVDERDSECVDYITEAQTTFHDARQRFLDACNLMEDAAANDRRLQDEIIELVGLINKANGAADSEGNRDKPRIHAAVSNLNSSASKASSINLTFNTALINNETSNTTRTSLASVSSPVHSSSLPDLMTCLVELTNERLQSCAVLDTKHSEVQFHSRMRDQAFIALNQLRLRALKDQTTELRDKALAYVFENERRMELSKKAKRKREEGEALESTRPVRAIEPAEIEEVGGSEDNEGGGVSLAPADEEKGKGDGKKKRRRKRKKAGQWRGLISEEARRCLAEAKAEAETSVAKAEKTAMDMAEAFLADMDITIVYAGTAVADGHLGDMGMGPIGRPPLPAELMSTSAESVTESNDHVPLPLQEQEQAQEQAQTQETDQEPEALQKQKRRRKRLSATEAYEKYFARGVQAREEAKMRELDPQSTGV